jgi:Ni,Fe-hydrogenase I small subunit
LQETFHRPKQAVAALGAAISTDYHIGNCHGTYGIRLASSRCTEAHAIHRADGLKSWIDSIARISECPCAREAVVGTITVIAGASAAAALA